MAFIPVAGADKQVQFNDGGDFGANSGMTFDKSTGKLTTTALDVGAVGGQVDLGSSGGKISFFGATAIVKPSGDVVTALSNLGLITSPTITSGINNPLAIQVFS